MHSTMRGFLRLMGASAAAARLGVPLDDAVTRAAMSEMPRRGLPAATRGRQGRGIVFGEDATPCPGAKPVGVVPVFQHPNDQAKERNTCADGRYAVPLFLLDDITAACTSRLQYIGVANGTWGATPTFSVHAVEGQRAKRWTNSPAPLAGRSPSLVLL